MSDFYPLRHNRMNRDMSLLKKLELKQKLLEEKVFNSNQAKFRKFKAHPNLIQSDSDTTATCTPRIITKFSASATSIVYGKPAGSRHDFKDTKQRAQDFHKLLHEKLSIINSNNPSERSDISGMGDSYMVSHKRIGDRFQSRRIKSNRSDSSFGSSSLDSDGEFSNSRCKSGLLSKKITKTENNRSDNNYSAASKATIGGDRPSAYSRLSSQHSFAPRGITLSVFEKKFKVIATKSLQNIDSIRATLSKGIVPPDGEEDESRRIVRVKEFSNRFSRNYLYPLARQVKDLEAISALSQLNSMVVNRKLLSTYQVLHNALQAYQTHLPTSLGDCTYTQLKILMSNIVQVCGIHRNQLKEADETYVVEFIDTFKVNAELTNQKIEELLNQPAPSEVALKSEQTNINLTKCGDKHNRKPTNAGKCLGKKGKLDSRLSMYTMTAAFRKDALWKRAVESLARKKFNVKSKYRTATLKHRPPLQRDPEIISLPKFKTMFPAKQSGVSKTTRLNSPVNEDCITTMVEADQNGATHLEKEEWENMEKKTDDAKEDVNSNKEEILIKLLQFTLKNHNQEPGDDKSQISEILTLIKKEPNDEFLKKVLEGLTDKDEQQKSNENKQELTLEIVKSQGSLSEGGASSREKTTRKEPKITVTGEKNALLICITDDNSVVEPAENDEPIIDKKASEIDNAEPAQVKTSSEIQTEIKEPNVKVSKGIKKGKQSNIKISRLKKSGRNLKQLDKKQAVDAIQYKLDFYRYCKNNPMYKRSTTCQPWVLMGKVSEELLNECLLSVAGEIEINDIVEKVYRSELQL